MNKWFEFTFIPNIVNKINENKKYHNSLILSEKQTDICKKYMIHKEKSTMSGRIGFYEMSFDGYTLTLFKKGKYNIIYMVKTPTKNQINNADLIREKIEVKESELDNLYINKDINLNKIRIIEKEIDDLWKQYNDCLKCY